MPGGIVTSLCHTHAWFSIPLLDYIVTSAGAAPTGQWLPFRELAGGRKWSGLFEQRCEKRLQLIADTQEDLFADLISMFSAASAHSTLQCRHLGRPPSPSPDPPAHLLLAS